MTISTPRDGNRTPTIMGTLNTDGNSPVSIAVNPSNNRMKYSDGTTGSNFPSVNEEKDNNRVETLWGVSSADGITPTYIAVDSSGNLMVNSS